MIGLVIMVAICSVAALALTCMLMISLSPKSKAVISQCDVPRRVVQMSGLAINANSIVLSTDKTNSADLPTLVYIDRGTNRVKFVAQICDSEPAPLRPKAGIDEDGTVEFVSGQKVYRCTSSGRVTLLGNALSSMRKVNPLCLNVSSNVDLMACLRLPPTRQGQPTRLAILNSHGTAPSDACAGVYVGSSIATLQAYRGGAPCPEVYGGADALSGPHGLAYNADTDEMVMTVINNQIVLFSQASNSDVSAADQYRVASLTSPSLLRGKDGYKRITAMGKYSWIGVDDARNALVRLDWPPDAPSPTQQVYAEVQGTITTDHGSIDLLEGVIDYPIFLENTLYVAWRPSTDNGVGSLVLQVSQLGIFSLVFGPIAVEATHS